MQIVVRFPDGEEAVQFDSRRNMYAPVSVVECLAQMGWALTSITSALEKHEVVDAWIQLDNGEKLSLARVR